MSEFSQKISAIQSDLNALTRSVDGVSTKVQRATQEFQEMAEQAQDIETLTTAVTKLGRLLNNDKSPLLDKLRTQVDLIAKELGKLKTKEIQQVTNAFERQAEVLKAVQSATSRLGTNLEKTSQGLASLSTALGGIKSSGAEGTLDQVAKALQTINGLTNIRTVISSINNIKGDKIGSTIASLEQLRNVMQEIERLGSIRVDVQDTPVKRRQRKTTNEQAEGVANDVANNLQNLPSNVPTSRTDAAQGAVSKLSNRARGIEKTNNAIRAVEAAQVKILEELLHDAGQSNKFELAKEALISRLSASAKGEAYQAFKASVPNAGAIAASYKVRQGREVVATGLPAKTGFDQIALGDQKAIDALYSLRRKMAQTTENLDTAVSGKDQASASLLTNLQSFSGSIYRPISYGVTEFGAFMNGVIATLRGIKTGGISGTIDALGGAFKSLHALNNAGAYFGVPLLPGGIGNVFNKKRSDTLLDVAEVGLNIGYGSPGRTGDDRRIRELSYEERQKVRERSRIQNLLGDEGLGEDSKAKLKTELDEVNAELKKLRASIRAYNLVIEDEVKREKIRAPLTSTGKDLANASVATSGGAYEAAMQHAQGKLDEILSTVETLDLDRFAAKIARLKLDLAGASAQNVAGVATAGGQIYLNKGFPEQVRQQVGLHEATHVLVDPAQRYDAKGGGNAFYNSELEDLRLLALERTKKAAKEKTAIIPAGSSGEYFSDAAEQNALEHPDYLLKANEIYANVSQAVLSGNKKFQEALKQIYGHELFDKIIADLRTLDPGTFNNIGQAQRQVAEESQNVYERLANKVKTALKETGNKGGPTPAAASILTSGPADPYTGITRTYKTPGTQPDLLTQLVTKYESQLNLAIDAISASSALDQPFSEDTLKRASGAFSKYTGLDTSAITKALGFSTIGNIAPDLIKALVDPSEAGFRQLGSKLGDINISRTLETYLKEQLNLKPFTRKELLDRAKNLEFPVAELVTRPFLGRAVTNIADSFNADDPNVDPRSVAKGNRYRKFLIGGLVDQLAVRDVNFEGELNDEIVQKTGRNIRRGSYSQQATFDPVTGLTKFIVSAQTADGAMVSLNAKVDEFGRKKIIDPADDLDVVGSRFKRFVSDVPNQLIQQVTYSIVNGIQQMASSLISVQDELAEVANLYGAVGEKAATVKESFLAGSVDTAISTGQGFQEAITTNLKNFKLLGGVKDPTQREALSNQLSTVQLGAQTAFGISLEQSLESIPAILSDITAQMGDVTDPVERTTRAIAELQDIMDQIIVAQRATGASGDELLTVYSRLAASAKQYGLTSKDLIALTSVGAVSIGKGESETSNILRSFLEGTYSSANESQLLKEFGIATRVTNTETGKITNRDFKDVLKDIYSFTQNPETEGRTAQLLQVFAGPKPAADIGKFVRGYGADFERSRGELDSPTAQGSFGELVSSKLDNYQGSINKLNAAGTELFSTFLVGTGVLAKLTNFLEKLSDAASKLSDFIKKGSGFFQVFINILTPNIIDKMITGLLGTVNVFSGLVKTIGSGQTVLRGLFAQMVGLDRAVKPIDKVALSLRAAIGAIEAMEKSTQRASASMVQNLEKVSIASGSTAKRTLSVVEQQAASASFIPNSPQSQKLLKNAKTLLAEVEKTYNEGTPSVSGQARLPPRVAATLGKVGDVAGSLAAPLAFDFIAGGLSGDNIGINAGAAVAGGFMGALTGNPALGVLFYSVFGEVFDRLDIPKYFHFSDKEANAFADALSRRLRKNTGTQTEEDIKVEDDAERARIRGIQTADVARTRGKELLGAFGIDKFASQVNRGGLDVFGNFNRDTSKDLYGSSSDLERYRRLVVDRKEPESLLDKYFTSSFNPTQGRTANLYEALGSDELRDLYVKSNVSNPEKFLTAFEELSKGKGQLIERKDIQDALLAFDTQQKERETGKPSTEVSPSRVVTQSAEDIIKSLTDNLQNVTEQIQNKRSIPYGLDTYSPFGPRYQALQSDFGPKIEASLKDTSKEGRERSQALIEEFERGKQALDSLPSSLQVLIPLAEALGLATDGLEQKLYNIGSAGQSTLVQRFTPALEAQSFNKQYEQKQANLQFLQGTDQYKGREPAIIKEAEALQKTLTADKARYAINQAYLGTLKEQTNVLLDQAGALEKQQATRKLISAGTPGTPAQFTPASIFDTKGTSATQLNNAIEFAISKQNKLAALNPEYRKEFAKDQFLLQSGGDYKGITGVNQGFVQEFLQNQKQQSQAPLEDLSKLSDQELQATLDRARSLQGQAEKLDPSRAGKYENERILILRKNNELLAQTGIGQEFLKAALQENTKATDTLRGHYNLPSNYKAPTIFDYYDQGGKEKGDKNFPTLASQGLVPLSFAQQLAQQLINPDNGEKGADLSGVRGGTAGARPLFYPTPGTPGTAAVYEEVPPQILPDTIGSDRNISTAMQGFLAFKDKQIQELLDATGATSLPGKPEPYASDLGATRLNKVEPYYGDLGANRIGKANVPTFNSGDVTSRGGIGGPLTTPEGYPITPRLLQSTIQPSSRYLLPEATTARSRDSYTSERGGGYTAPKNAAEVDAELGKLKNNTGGLSTSFNQTKEATTGLVSSLKLTAEASKSFAASNTAANTMNSGATAFASTVTNLQQKVAQFDLSNIIKNAIFNMVVNIDGQRVSGVNAQVLTNATAQTGSALLAGAGSSSTGSGTSGRR